MEILNKKSTTLKAPSHDDEKESIITGFKYKISRSDTMFNISSLVRGNNLYCI